LPSILTTHSNDTFQQKEKLILLIEGKLLSILRRIIMINKPILNIICSIALLCPVVSTAAGLAEAEANQPASTQKTGNQSEFSAFEGAEVSNVDSKGDVKQSQKSSETDLDNFEWMSVDWYEVY
jgi:hypothetical protein